MLHTRQKIARHVIRPLHLMELLKSNRMVNGNRILAISLAECMELQAVQATVTVTLSGVWTCDGLVTTASVLFVDIIIELGRLTAHCTPTFCNRMHTVCTHSEVVL